MKYEIKNGSAKDFEGAPEWCRLVVGIPGCSDRVFVEALCAGARHQFIGSTNVSHNSDLHDKENHYIIAERRPITEPAVWLNLDECDGSEYLGPVIGKEMECHAKDGSIFVVVVVAFDGDLPIVKTRLHGNYFGCDPSQLKPIRSAEEVARDAGIKKIMATFKVDGELVPDNVAEAMWDAGYRKME